MNRRNIPPFLLFYVALGVSLAPGMAPAHNVPTPLPAPRSEGEAWSVIEESAVDVDRLLELRLPREAVFQMANIGVAMVELKNLSAKYPDIETIAKLADTLTTDGFQVVLASRDKDDPIGKTREQWDHYRKVLKALESRFPPEVVHAAVYICPMHSTSRILRITCLGLAAMALPTLVPSLARNPAGHDSPRYRSDRDSEDREDAEYHGGWLIGFSEAWAQASA